MRSGPVANAPPPGASPSAGARRRLPAALALAGLSFALAGCGAKAPSTAPLKVRGTALPARAGPVRLTQAAYRGGGLALYRTAARYFRWPVLVPASPPGGARATGATVSRFFAGSFMIDAAGRATQVPDSFVPGTAVAPAAYQLRIAYLGGRAGLVTLFEAVHPYAPPKGARSVGLAGGLRGGMTWQVAPAPGAATLRYVEGHADGLYLMTYASARRASEAALAAYFADLRAVAVPPGKAPVATRAGNAPPNAAKNTKRKSKGGR
jgi:hypothetical protein